jgi:hypothetical protein
MAPVTPLESVIDTAPVSAVETPVAATDSSAVETAPTATQEVSTPVNGSLFDKAED